MLLIGVVLIAAIAAGAYYFANNNSKSSGSGGGSSVSITPSSVSCSGAEVQITLSVRLSGSIPGSTQVSSQVDGITASTESVETGFVKQADGTWLSSAPESSTNLCGSLGAGKHTIGVLDASGKVIAEGSFTLTP